MQKKLTLSLLFFAWILVFTTTSCSGKSDSNDITASNIEIDLNEFITVSFSGYNLAGTGKVKFDKESFLLEHIDDISFNEDNYRAYVELYGDTEESAAKNILNYISVSLDSYSKLSNGDSVKITWDIDSKMISTYFQLDYICSEQVFTVTGLVEAGTFDPFENIEVSYSGYAPFGKASAYSSSYDDMGTYTVTPNENLKNGDTVSVSFSCDDDVTMIEKYGEYPSTFEKTYTVSGLGYYAQSFSDLSVEQQEAILSNARGKIWISGYGTYLGADYCGCYFYTAKDQLAHGVQFFEWCGVPVGNGVCFVFKHPEEINVNGSPDVYTVVRYQNILIEANGELSYERLDMTYKYETLDEIKEAYVGVYDEIMNCTDNIVYD